MSSLSRELVFLILQFLDEEKFKETVHKLEQESGFFFNMKYFEEQVQNGEWDQVERYLSGFTKVEDNRYSMKIFFEIRKQKYLEALDRKDRAKAVDILVKDLKVFQAFNEELYKEITQLLTLDNFRENEQLSKYGDTKSARNIMLLELKKLIEANPLFREKLTFPGLKASRLRTLINQSLNWQHQLCKNPRPNPDIKTLFVDHTCGGGPNGARAPPAATNPLGGLPKGPGFPPLGVHNPFQAAPPAANALAGWMGNPNPGPHAGVVAAPPSIPGASSNTGMLKRPRTPPTGANVDYADSDHLSKRRPPAAGQHVEEVNFSGPSTQPARCAAEDIPKAVARTMSQGSCVASMDFHPIHQVILLVGTNVGEISIWDVATRERLLNRAFKVWDIGACTVQLQSALVKDPAVAVNRVVWSPDGAYIGVAFNKHIVQVYQYGGGSDLRHQIEIDAHIGSVNDLAFALPLPDKMLHIISCGDDKTIKVWDVLTGRNKFTFEGHEAPVYSVCPHYKETIQFVFSTAMDGKIKAWLYDSLGSRVDYDAPGNWCTTMAYSADGTRLFSCGTSKEGDSYLVEWNETEGAIKRTYNGFRKRMPHVAQFDTTRNCFLAVGDEFSIKFWDMDNVNLLTSIDADGGLPACPRIRFNKDGTLLAVTTNDNGFKILANGDGMKMLRTLEASKVSGEVKPGSGPFSSSATAIVSVENGVKPRSGDENGKVWKLAEIVEPTQCRSLKLPDSMSISAGKISRLLFTNAGTGLLALASNATHKLWKWARVPLGKQASASVAPTLFQPNSGILMTNDTTESTEEAVPCIALSKNDSYVMSASGGMVSLFNMMTFKVMTMFMSPPPAATYLAFHPQDNNVIAIGMEDSTIQIYNVRVDEVKCKLKGHQKKITGLAFSSSLQVLVSSGADDQLCVWSTDHWDKLRTKSIGMPGGKQGDTRVQFHNDQNRLLVVHESQLAIYDASKLECLRKWTPKDKFSAGITSGTYSCDSKLVYATFADGAIGVFDADTLRPCCRISPAVYGIQSGVCPLVVAFHTSEPNLFAIGLSDGSVHVLEPLESEPGWGTPPPSENGLAVVAVSVPASTGALQISDQASR